MSNEEQIAYWSGPGGEHWAREHERYELMLRPFAHHLIDALAPQPSEHVLDVGCGNGALTLALAKIVGDRGRVVGIDVSTPQLARARKTVADAGLRNVDLIEADAQTHRFDGTFDALVSRFGVMFFDDPGLAFTNLATALRPGGRVAFLCWQELSVNEWFRVPNEVLLEHVPLAPPGDGPGPFSLGDPDVVRAHLAAARLDDVVVKPVVEHVSRGDTVEEVVQFTRGAEIGRRITSEADPRTAERAWAALAERLTAFQRPDGVIFETRAWLVTARRG